MILAKNLIRRRYWIVALSTSSDKRLSTGHEAVPLLTSAKPDSRIAAMAITAHAVGMRGRTGAIGGAPDPSSWCSTLDLYQSRRMPCTEAIWLPRSYEVRRRLRLSSRSCHGGRRRWSRTWRRSCRGSRWAGEAYMSFQRELCRR